jgi:aminoglycoside/choline kinase family phosphotransferase
MVLRTTQLNHWVNSVLSIPASEENALVPISGDASFRHYYRVWIGSSSYVAVDAPPERENNAQFVALAKLLGDNNVNVPEVHHVDYEQGFMLLSDMGDELYYAALLSDNKSGAGAAEKTDDLYNSAIECLVRIQSIDFSSCSIPVFDADFILRELNLFPEWFVGGQLELDNYPAFHSVSSLLVDNALEQPQVLMHRDYHSRNLMIRRQNSPGILDFQDAVSGPVTYDLASLLKDCYLRWPDEKISSWIQVYITHAEAAGVLSNTDPAQLLRWFDLIALQRHIKCAGIFTRLFLRDSKSIYLQDIPRLIGYIMNTTRKYPELSPFNAWLTQKVLPRMTEMKYTFEPDPDGRKK